MLEHGQYVAPHIRALELPDDPPPNLVARNTLHGVVERYDKQVQASTNPSTFGNVAAVYRHAVCIQLGGSAQYRGAGLFFPLLGIIPIAIFHADMWKAFADVFMYGGWFLKIQALVIGFLALFVFPGWIWRVMRFDLFGAADWPTIFDRKRRKVYLLVPPQDGSSERGKGRFGKIHAEVVAYDWDLVTAEHRVEATGTANTVSRLHRLVMVVRDRLKPGQEHGRLLDEFDVGNSAALGEGHIRMWWEYLRRYMEERGPVLPPGESVAEQQRPTTLWQSMGVVSPFGPRFMEWWRESRFVTIFFLLIAPFSVPFFTLWAVCNWISHKTMREVVWPQELVDLVGHPAHSS